MVAGVQVGDTGGLSDIKHRKVAGHTVFKSVEVGALNARQHMCAVSTTK